MLYICNFTCCHLYLLPRIESRAKTSIKLYKWETHCAPLKHLLLFPIMKLSKILLLFFSDLIKVLPLGNAVNESPELSRVGVPYANTTFLLKNIQFQDGVIFAYSFYFLSNRPFRIQVWRPRDIFKMRFQLLWESRIVPNEWNKRVDVSCFSF